MTNSTTTRTAATSHPPQWRRHAIAAIPAAVSAETPTTRMNVQSR